MRELWRILRSAADGDPIARRTVLIAMIAVVAVGHDCLDDG